MIWALSSSKEQADSQRNNAEKLHDKAIAILSADVLRSSNSRIGQGLSWDTLAQQTYKAVCEIGAFKHFRWVIISFATVGALVVSRPGSDSKRSAFLIFDPTELEGSWIAKHPGDMLGLTTCLVSTTARSLIKLAVAPPATVDDNSLTDALITGIRDGLICMRALYRGGYYTDNAHADPNREPRKYDDDDINQTTKWLTSGIKDAYPASGLKADNLPFAKVTVEYPDSKGSWNNTMSHPTADHELGDAIALPLVRARMGVSDRVDLGVTGGADPRSNYGVAGVEAKIALLRQGPGRPVSVAIRPTVSALIGPSEVFVGNASLDLSVSRRMGAWAPYVGGSSLASLGVERSKDVDLKDEALTRSVVFGGVAFEHRGLSVAAEAEHGKLTSVSLRVSARF